MISATDITIIGGGVIGLLTAREFLAAGATVTILERNFVGQESSWAGGGILLPLYPWRQAQAITQLVIQSLKLYPELAHELAAQTPVHPEWYPCGLLITKNPDIAAAVQWCNQNLITFKAVDTQFCGILNTDVNNPLWLPTIAQIRNPRLLKSLKYDLIQKGVIFREQCQITKASVNQQRISYLETQDGKVSINQLIIAAGAWSQQLFELFPYVAKTSPHIAPIRGQMLVYDALPKTLPYIVLDDDHYLIPRQDGKILVGSTVEQEGFNKITTEAAKHHLQTFALNLLPELKQYPLLKHWAGLRPGTHYGVPYIDKHPHIKNLSINAGHFRNGLVMGPASAQLMVDLILNRPTHIDPTPYKLNIANLALSV